MQHTTPLQRRHKTEIAVFLAIVFLGVTARCFFHFVYYLPNFAPVAGLALFAGYFFRSRLAAVAAPLAVMLVSDLFIGGYQPALMLVVYGALAAPVLARGFLRRTFDGKSSSDNNSGWRRAIASVAGLAACGLAASAGFFLVTNFAVWGMSVFSPAHAIYAPTFEGLLLCFTQALPFFRYTLAGDLFFSLAFFGGYVGLQTAFAAASPTAPRRLMAAKPQA